MKSVVWLTILLLCAEGEKRGFSETPAKVAGEQAQLLVIDQPELDAKGRNKREARGAMLDRIEQMVGIDAPTDDSCYKALVKAYNLGLVAKIPVATGGRTPSTEDLQRLAAALDQPPFKKWEDDPTIRFIVLGFADSSTDYYENIALAKERADSVLKTVRGKLGGHVTYSIPMGSARLVEAEKPSSEYPIEIWVLW